MVKEKYIMEVKEVKVMGDREIYTVSSESKKGQKWFASYNKATKEYVCSCPKYFLSDKEKCKHLVHLEEYKAILDRQPAEIDPKWNAVCTCTHRRNEHKSKYGMETCEICGCDEFIAQGDG